MWFTIAIISFFLLAMAAIVDKYILTKTKVIPISYVFYISLLGSIVSNLLIFFEDNFFFPQEHLGILIVGGASFYFALYFLFLAVTKSEVSRVNPLIVSLTPLFIFIFSFQFSFNTITFNQLIGVLAITLAGYFLSQVGHLRTKIKSHVWFFILASAIMFALANSFNKLAYLEMPFIMAFVYLKWISLITAILFTSIKGGWSEIIKLKAKDGVKTNQRWLAFFIGQITGGAGVVMMQYAINLGNVILVTALNGIQFFFIISLVFILSKFKSQIYQENVSKAYLIPKIVYSIILFLGIFLILT